MAVSIWSDERAPRSTTPPAPTKSGAPPWERSSFQKDYDRLLFSTPVRRLSDKTQVWPMEMNDGVRTRLTHSHEVANLAKSIGTRIAKRDPSIFRADLHDCLQPILSAIGLAHDLGNPPFGHQGETAIGRWFEERKSWIFRRPRESSPETETLDAPLPDYIWQEFISFDGNPQSFRLLTRLQTHTERVGLDLTAATLAASLKYPVGVANRSPDNPVAKKFGYFQSERSVIDWVRRETGLNEGERHPLTWIMEACDDIAYSVLDVDDAMKKGVVSPDDVIAILHANEKVAASGLIEKLRNQFDRAASASARTKIIRDIKINYLRATLIDALIEEASDTFLSASQDICAFKWTTPLMHHSALCDALKGVAKEHAFSNSGVLRMEALGSAAISELMTLFWESIHHRKDQHNILSRKTTAIGEYVFGHISSNYLEESVRPDPAGGLQSSMRYRELRLLTDMISGMTDSFAINLAHDLKGLPR